MKNKKVLLIAGIVLVLVVAGSTTFILLGGQPLVLHVSVAGAASPATDPVPVLPQPTPVVPRPDPDSLPPAAGIMVDLGSKVVNLADPGGYRLLRVGLVLEFAPNSLTYYAAKAEQRTKEEEALRAEVTRCRPVIDDIVISLLSNKTFGDIFTLQGKEALKAELRDTVNSQLGNLRVLRVYFTDFLVQ